MRQQYKLIFAAGLALLAVSSCQLDNYEQPDAALFGTVTDAQTGEIIPQDIGDQGSHICLWEIADEYPTPGRRTILFKTNGTYMDKNYFSGKYKIKLNETNFNAETAVVRYADGTEVPAEVDYTDKKEENGLKWVVDVNGHTQVDIEAEPWCRVIVKDITFDQAKQRVVAQFEVECTSNDKLAEIGMFCDLNPHVSYSINNFGDASVKKKAVDRVLGEPETFTLKMPLSSFDKDKDSDKDYWIRVGARSDAKDARWNFAPAVKVHLVKEEIQSRKLGIRWDLFDGCNDEGVQDAAKFAVYKAMWERGQHRTMPLLYFDTKDKKSGAGCWVAVSNPIPAGDKYPSDPVLFISPGYGHPIVPSFDASAIPDEGNHMLLTIYVSDATHFERDANGQIEIGSGGDADNEEACWTFGQFELRNGWQTLDLGLPDANKLGDFYSGAINWFRFYHGHEMVGNTTVKFDEIRFYYKTIVDACEDNRPWSSNGAAVTLDEADCKEGESSISTTNGPQGIRLSRTYSPVIKTPAKLAKGHFQFWLYVSDAAKFNAVDTQVEITSSGKADVNELHWLLPKDLEDGWNLIDFKLSDGVATGGEIDLRSVNFFRIHNAVSGAEGSITMKIDRLRFFNEGVDMKLSDVPDEA